MIDKIAMDEIKACVDQAVVNERIRHGAASKDIGDAIVEQYGPFTAKVVMPSEMDEEAMDELSDMLDGLPVTRSPGVILSVIRECDGDEPTEEDMRTFVFDVKREFCTFSGEEIRRHREQNVIEIDPAWAKGRDSVFMTLARQPFREILEGSKKIEYREYKEYWVKKLIAPRAKFVTFQNGYRPGAEQMTFAVDHIDLLDEDEETSYSPWNIPPMSTPDLIRVHLGKRMI